MTTFDERSLTNANVTRRGDARPDRIQAESSLTFPAWPQFGEPERQGLLSVLEQLGWWRMAGQQVTLFEAEFAAHHGAPHTVATNSGTAALELGLNVLGVGPGDEVILPAFTFFSCALAVQTLGAVPVPVDVHPDTYCLDIAATERAITKHTRVIMPVHMAGQFVDMDALTALAESASVAVLQDAAHAHGARWRGRRVGDFAQVAAFSFQNGKLMTAGEGGALLLPDDDTHRAAHLRHSCGRPDDDQDYQHVTQGSNNRMNEFSASVLRAQLGRLEEQIDTRERGWLHLREGLARIPGVVPQHTDPRADRNSRYMAMVRIPSVRGADRRALVDALKERDIPAFVAFPPVYRTKGFWAGPTRDQVEEIVTRCPISEDIGQDCVWLHHRILLADTNTLDCTIETLADVISVFR